VHIACGIFVNQVGTGVVFAGIRMYLKYIPFFFVPLVFRFTDKELITQIKLVAGLTLLQLQIALYQRIKTANLSTGDAVGGTLVVSSHLSIYLISCSAVVLSAFLKGMISRTTFFVLIVLVLIPTTINETKGTFILLPFALFLPVLFNPNDPHRFRRMIGVSLVGIIFVAVYIPIYDHFKQTQTGRGIIGYWTSPAGLQDHLAPQTLDRHDDRVGRVDVMLAPAKELSGDPVKLFFGLGIGNVSDSALGERFVGEYYTQYDGLTYLAIAHLQWEIGVFGLLMVIALWLLIGSDARKLAGRDDIYGVLALGWIGVLGVLFVSLFYKDIIAVNAISYLFWFYSGVLVSAASRFGRQSGTAESLEAQGDLSEQWRIPRAY